MFVPAFESKDFQRLSHPEVEEEDPSEVAPQSQEKSYRPKVSQPGETPRDKQITEEEEVSQHGSSERFE